MDPADPVQTRQRLDALLDAQEHGWRVGSGVPVEALLEQLPARPPDGEEVLYLLCNEIVLRRQLGPQPTLDEYQRRFPEHAHELAIWFAADSDGISEFAPVRASPPREQEGSHAPVLSGAPAIAGYDILGELGRGGMGVVYKARQVALNRLVALKVLLSGAMAGREERSRFKAEAEAVARLQHPHIVQIYEIGEQDGCPYLALEFVEGPSLKDEIGGIPQPAAAAARLVEVLARGLHHAHRHGIVHRDLNPTNVLMSARRAPDGDWGEPKVTDFGLAKRLDADSLHTQSGAQLGTPSYMPPEQARDAKQAGPAADVYALGAILYELLTGRAPFLGASVPDTLRQVCEREPVAIRQLNPDVPRELETICLKCLEKEPQQRYGTAEGLAEDLRRFRAGEPIVARPVGLPRRLVKWCRRNRTATATIAVLVFLVGVLAALGARLYEEQQQTKRAVDRADREQQQTKRAVDRADRNTTAVHKTVTEMLMRLENPDLARHPEIADLHEGLSQQALQLFGTYIEDDGAPPDVRTKMGNTYIFVGYVHRSRHDGAQARNAYQSAVAVYEGLARDFPNNSVHLNDVGQAHHILALEIAASDGITKDVTDECRKAKDAYREALRWGTDLKRSLDYSSWFLSICPDRQFRDPQEAVTLANKLVTKEEETPADDPAKHLRMLASAYNDLGAACYRNDDPRRAIDAMQEAMKYRRQARTKAAGRPRDGEDSHDTFILAMAYWQSGKADEAALWYRKALDWMNKYMASDAELRLFRKEAADLMGPPVPGAP